MEVYFPAVFEKTASGWSVYFPDIDGCISAGDSFAEAFSMAEEALQFHLDGMAEDGEALPDPRSIEDVKVRMPDRVQLVPARKPGRTLRVNITMDEALIERIKGQTRNVSGFLAEAAREKLRQRG